MNEESGRAAKNSEREMDGDIVVQHLTQVRQTDCFMTDCIGPTLQRTNEYSENVFLNYTYIGKESRKRTIGNVFLIF